MAAVCSEMAPRAGATTWSDVPSTGDETLGHEYPETHAARKQRDDREV